VSRPRTNAGPGSGPDPAADPGDPDREGDRDGSGSSASRVPPRVEFSTRGLPDWLKPVLHVAGTVEPRQLSRFLPPPDGAGRPSAVLVLFGEGADGPELLLMERASSLRSHAGQPSFPGGAIDPEDGDPEGEGRLRAALREAEEETGLDPSGVQIFGTLPALYIPVSGFVVTPVLGWWHRPTPVSAMDPAETAHVFTVPVTRAPPSAWARRWCGASPPV
jgi:8-oxo-dGTP pyrophosphatase MutT (NUDIX family)